MHIFLVEFLILPACVPDVNCYYNVELLIKSAVVGGNKIKLLCSLAIVTFEYRTKNTKLDFGEVRFVVQMVSSKLFDSVH